MRGLFAVLALGLIAACSFGQLDFTKQMSIEQKLGAQVPLDVPFKDEHGKDIKFGDVFHGRPVILMPAFYTCLSVCSAEFDSVMQSAVRLKKECAIGKDFDIVVVSINPKEGPADALKKEKEMQGDYEDPHSASGWHFLTGTLDNIHRVTDAIGFKYSYDAQYGLIDHPAGIMILTPTGQVSSYMLGSDYPYIPLEKHLKTAGAYAVGNKTETILLGCVMIDPRRTQWTHIVDLMLKICGTATVLVLGFSILKMSLDSKRQEAQRNALAEIAAKGTLDS